VGVSGGYKALGEILIKIIIILNVMYLVFHIEGIRSIKMNEQKEWIPKNLATIDEIVDETMLNFLV
jgi:hypothetical protein